MPDELEKINQIFRIHDEQARPPKTTGEEPAPKASGGAKKTPLQESIR